MQKFYQNPTAHSVINRSPYQPYASNLTNSLTNSTNSTNPLNTLNSLNGFNNGLNSVTSISSNNSSINNSARYSTSSANNTYGHHMQAAAVAAVTNQFNIGNSSGNNSANLHQADTTTNTDDWYGKNFARINPLQYQA